MSRILLALSCLAVLSGPAALADASHFPIHVGDAWVYESRHPVGSTAEIQVTVDRTSGQWFHLDRFLGAARWVLPYKDRLYVWDGHYVRLVDFAAAVGTTFKIDLSGGICNQATLTLAEKGASVRTPAGAFDDCIRVDWRTNCADAGVISQWYSPAVGLVRWTESNFAGQVDVVLKRATIDGQQFPDPNATAAGVSVCLTLDRYDYFQNRMPVIGPTPRPVTVVKARFAITNNTGSALTFHFRSSQKHDLMIVDSKGTTLWTWSANKRFMMALTRHELAPGDTWVIEEEIPIDVAGGFLPQGEYLLRFTLVGEDKRFQAMAPFRVSYAY